MDRKHSVVPLDPPARRFSVSHVPQPIYLGVDIVISEDTHESSYFIVAHDGSFASDYYTGKLCSHPPNVSYRECVGQAMKQLQKVIDSYVASQCFKVQIISCTQNIAKVQLDYTHNTEHSAMSDFWRVLDAIPFTVHSDAENADERASAAVRKAILWLSPQYPGNLPRISVGFRHEVEVDFDYRIHLVDILDYRKTVCDSTWRIFCQLAEIFKERRIRVSIFSSTPQGGGVALMRHALLRFLHLNGIRLHWYVARPKPEIYKITKYKFHNVLQGVSPEGEYLTESEFESFISWSNENVERFWLDDKGPIKNSDVIIIDDTQVVGVIPYIRKYAPETRIIFRSHIQIRSDLIREDPSGPQASTWKTLWNFIQKADLFIAHPVEGFVPDQVPRRNVVLMPACTDPLDGLNKSLTPRVIDYYRSVFNRVCIDQGAEQVDWNRPYIAQIARFDPSKGIPDCIEAYRKLREKLNELNISSGSIPQLIICGHGSVDDPEGTVIYERTHKLVQEERYAEIAPDIIIARLPPSDQLLNMVLRGAYTALQLSTREGFEVKVTEAFHKGVPVIAYATGGIPLQVKDGVNGFLIKSGDIDGVVDKLVDLFTHPGLRKTMSKACLENLTEEFFTVTNATNWLYLFTELTNRRGGSAGLMDIEKTYRRNSCVGDGKKVADLWKDRYG